MKWMLQRLNEPSTWAGLAAIAAAGQIIAADPKNPAAWLTALGGAMAAVKREQGGV